MSERTRILKACDWCRRRKIKCDGDGPPCYKCAENACPDLCVYMPRPLSNREMFPPLGASSASPRYNAYGMPLSILNPPSGPGSSHSSPVDASRISSPSYSIAAPPRSQSGSPASEASGVSHPPGSGKRRRRTTADVSSQELLDYVRNWDNGESPAGWGTLPPYSMLPDAAETPFAAQQNPWARWEYLTFADSWASLILITASQAPKPITSGQTHLISSNHSRAFLWNPPALLLFRIQTETKKFRLTLS